MNEMFFFLDLTDCDSVVRSIAGLSTNAVFME